jgi:dipeptidyl aminopeptidase/acylaminoacyl peptidase
MYPRLVFAAVVLAALPAFAQDSPPARVSGANYPLAQKFNAEFVAQHLQTVNVVPRWVGTTDTFWYAAATPTGTRYWKVDPAKKEKVPLFDHDGLAAKLSEASKKPLDAETLRLTNPNLSDDAKKLTFSYGEYRYEYDLTAAALKQTGRMPLNAGGPLTPERIEQMRQQFGNERVDEMLKQIQGGGGQQQDTQQQDTQQQGTQPPPTGGSGGSREGSYKSLSPDKKWYVFAQKHNLFLGEEGQPDDKAVQITTDGAEDYSFGGGGGRGFGGGERNTTGETQTQTQTGSTATPPTTPPTDRKSRPNVTWSADSKFFHISRNDSRGLEQLWLVDSIAQPRPKLESYPYPMPGEDKVRRTELWYADVAKKAATKVTPKWKDERYSDVRWGKGPGELRFIRRDRLQRNLEVCALDAATGKTNALFAEAFESANLGLRPNNPRYVEETDEMIWWSERSGWGHFYLYGRDGKLKNAITSGAWRASAIVDVDAKTKTLYVVGNSREPGENVYFQHLYRVKFDGTGLTLLDPSVTPDGQPMPGGFNQVSATSGFGGGGGGGGFGQGQGQTQTPPAQQRPSFQYLSGSRKFLVVNSTRTDAAPFATVRDDAGKVVMTLETTDTSRLEKTGWKHAETFVVKAADGVTDLYGNLWKPFDFDPKKKYPIIAYVYPGPQQEGVTHRFTAYSSYMQLAQLGFVVIQVGHRGGSPERSKAYHSFGYFNLRDYGLIDKKAAIEALAARHTFIDIDRVGIYGHSGGGFMSAAALLQKPYNEFFKAAVASAGNHDNNIYNDNWSEQYHGMKEVAVADPKKDGTATGTTTGTGTGTGGGRGTGGRRPPVEELEAELLDLLEATDPDGGGQQSAEELKKKLEEIRTKIATLEKEKAEAEKTEVKKTDAKPATKFEIKVPTNAELAANLKGHLMLVHGEVDNNVHPANTMRLVDALIKANKRFDLLIIPGARHSFGVANPYFTQKMWDFFAEHLLDDRQTGADIYDKGTKRK